MTQAEFDRLSWLERHLQGDLRGQAADDVLQLRDEYRRLYALWFAMSPNQRSVLQHPDWPVCGRCGFPINPTRTSCACGSRADKSLASFNW